MSVQSATIFRTTDNQVFESEAEAFAHQSALDAAGEIKAFVVQSKAAGKVAQETRYTNIVAEYLTWKAKAAA